jgi:hypothetical protein
VRKEQEEEGEVSLHTVARSAIIIEQLKHEPMPTTNAIIRLVEKSIL